MTLREQITAYKFRLKNKSIVRIIFWYCDMNTNPVWQVIYITFVNS